MALSLSRAAIVSGLKFLIMRLFSLALEAATIANHGPPSYDGLRRYDTK